MISLRAKTLHLLINLYRCFGIYDAAAAHKCFSSECEKLSNKCFITCFSFGEWSVQLVERRHSLKCRTIKFIFTLGWIRGWKSLVPICGHRNRSVHRAHPYIFSHMQCWSTYSKCSEVISNVRMRNDDDIWKKGATKKKKTGEQPESESTRKLEIRNEYGKTKW